MKWTRIFRVPAREFGHAHWRLARDRGFRLAQRADPVLATIVTSVVIIMILAALIFGGLRSLFMEAQPVKDNRILGSFTAEGPCFMSSATDEGGGVWASLRNTPACQSNVASGGLAPYDPIWRTWGREVRPFQEDHGRIAPSTLMRLEDQVWIKGDAGGLAAAGADGDWRIWLSQSVLRENGKPVEQAHIAAAAQIEQDEGLIVATRTGLAARYDAATGRWDALTQLPGEGDVDQLLTAAGALWISRGSALWRMRMSTDGTRLDRPEQMLKTPVSQVLSVGQDVIALTRAPCAVAKETCSLVILFPKGQAQGETLLDTRNAPRGWTGQDVHYVGALPHGLVLAGPKGATRYNTTTRNWTPLEQKPVTVFAAQNGTQIAIGGRGFTTLFKANTQDPISANLPDKTSQINSLAFDAEGRLHLSSDRGSLWLMGKRGRLTSRFKRSAPLMSQKSVAILSDANTDLFLTQNGEAIAFDRDTRRYQPPSRSDSLSALAKARLRHFEGNPVLAVTPPSAGISQQVIAIDIASPARARIAKLPGTSPATSITQVSPELGLATTEDGRLVEVHTRSAKLSVNDAMPGQPTNGMDNKDLADISSLGADMLIGGLKGISRYNVQSRSWKRLWSKSVTSIAGDTSKSQVLAVDGNARMFSVNTSGKRTQLIGGRNFPFPNDQHLVDALIHPDHGLIMLAGDGRGGLYLEQYDPEYRVSATLATFRPHGPLDAEILSFNSLAQWLVRVGRDVYVDETQPVARKPDTSRVFTGWRENGVGAVVSLSQDKTSGLNFLRRSMPDGAAARCLFRGSGFSYGPETSLKALPDGGLAALAPRDIQLYDAATHRWFETALPGNRGPFDFSAAHGAIWASQRGSVVKGQIWRIARSHAGSRPDSCSANSPKRTVEAYGMAAVNADGTRILHRPQLNVVQITNTSSGITEDVFRTPSYPHRYGMPLRALIEGEVLWLAFDRGVLKYSLTDRRWIVVASIPKRDWSQVTMQRGTGANQAQMIVNYAQGNSTKRVSIPLSATVSTRSTVKKTIHNPVRTAPLKLATGTVVDTWADGEMVAFRLPEKLIVLNRKTDRWIDSTFPVAQADDVIGTIGRALVGWSPSERRFYYQGNRKRSLAYGNPRKTDPLPERAAPLLTRDGLPAYFTPDGAFTQCDLQGNCREIIAAPAVFDLRKLAKGYRTVTGFVLIGTGGGATYLDTQSHRFRRLFAGSSPYTQRLEDWTTEHLKHLWPAKSGDAVVAEARDGAVAIISRTGPRQTSLPTALGGAQLQAFNPDEGIGLTSDGLIAWEQITTPVPTEVAPETILQIGRHQQHVWFATATQIKVYPETCLTSAPLTDPETDTENETGTPECTPRLLPRPAAAPIAYFTGDWSGDTTLAAQLKSGGRLEWHTRLLLPDRWRATSAPAVALLDVTADLIPLLSPRPDGKLSLHPSTRLVSETESGVTLDVPGTGRLDLLKPDGLSMPELDLGWLSFDRSKGIFTLGTGANRLTLAANEAFDPSGHFLPFVVQGVMAQANGDVLFDTPLGLRRLTPNQKVHDDASDRSFVPLPTNNTDTDVLDEGGLWRQDRFYGMNGDRRSPAIAQTKGMLTISGDRRRPAVTLEHGTVNAWRAGQGFAWDMFLDLGWSQNAEPMMATALGALHIKAPLSPPLRTEIDWSGESFQRLNEKNVFAFPDSRYTMPATSSRTTRTLPSDTINDAAMINGTLVLATDRGAQYLKSFAYNQEISGLGTAIKQINLHRPSQLAVLTDSAGSKTVTDGTAPAHPPSRSQRQALTSEVQGKIGPLHLIRRGTYSLHLVDSSSPRNKVPALLSDDTRTSRMATDFVTGVVINDAGTMLLATQAGHSILPDRNMSLSSSRLFLPRTPGSDLDVHETPKGQLAIERTGSLLLNCRAMKQSELSASCGTQLPQSELRFDTASGPLTARRGPGEVSFTLSPSDANLPMAVTLKNGRLNMDRITHVAACHGFTHYFSSAGLHLRQPTEALDWTTAKFIARRAQPLALHCPEAFEQNGLRSSLFALTRETAEANLLDDTDAVPFGPSATIARFVSGPALPTAGLTHPRVFRSIPNTAHFEMGPSRKPAKILNIGGQMRDLKFLKGKGPATLIDIPFTFLLIEDRVWAVTGDGIVPMGTTQGKGAIQLETDGPHILDLPQGCTKISHAIWINAAESDLHCEIGQLRITGDGNGGLVMDVHPSPRRFTAQVGPLAIRTLYAQGISRIALAGEELSFRTFSGGFTFDKQLTLASTPDGNLITTSGSGWHLYRGNSLALSVKSTRGLHPMTRQTRTRFPSLRKAARVSRTEQPEMTCVELSAGASSPILYLKSRKTGFEQIQRDGNQCFRFLARDSIREAWASTRGNAIFALRFGNDELIPDPLERGRFQGDTALGPPHLELPSQPGEIGAVFCTESMNDRLAIAGNNRAANRRVPLGACVSVRSPAPPHADGASFFVQKGQLLRRRLP